MGRLDETRRVSRLLDIAWRLAAHHEVGERQITSDLTVMRYGLHWQVCTSHTGYYVVPTHAGVNRARMKD